MSKASIDRIEFKNVNIHHRQRKILSNCSFEFPMNANCRLIFSDDAQKFFFFHSLANVKGFVSGQFLVNQNNILEFSFDEFLKYRKNIGFGFSTRGILHNKTLFDNVMLPVAYHSFLTPKERKEWVEFLFEYFEAADDMDKKPSDVIPSTQKVTLLIRAMVHRPDWLILDSPEVFLSRRLYANFLQSLTLFRKEYGLKHLFFSTYDEDLSDCLAEVTLKVEKEKINILKIRVNEFGRSA